LPHENTRRLEGAKTVSTVAVALPLLANSNDGWGHPWWPLWLFFWAALIGTTVWLIARRRDRRGDPLDRAREVLAERYARGEISAEDYRERLDELTRSFQGAKLDR
jgi:putative membrane protein